MAALYHGAFYLEDHTVHLAVKTWAFPAMVVGAAILAVYVIVQNVRQAGLIWGTAVTAAQSLVLVVLGPMFAAMLALFVFRGVTKTWRGGGFPPASPAPQQNFSIRIICRTDAVAMKTWPSVSGETENYVHAIALRSSP